MTVMRARRRCTARAVPGQPLRPPPSTAVRRALRVEATRPHRDRRGGPIDASSAADQLAARRLRRSGNRRSSTHRAVRRRLADRGALRRARDRWPRHRARPDRLPTTARSPDARTPPAFAVPRAAHRPETRTACALRISCDNGDGSGVSRVTRRISPRMNPPSTRGQARRNPSPLPDNRESSD